MEIFEYAFMQRAFIVGILLAAIIPCIGLVIVCKRLSMIGDALSHTSLAGVAAGLLLGLRRYAGRFPDFRKCPLLSLCLPGLAWRAFCQDLLKMQPISTASCLEVLWQSVTGSCIW